MKRGAGILLPITSLPSRYGIGTMGKSAEDFIDFLEKAGQAYWQILPIGPTGYGDSPYQPFSSFAGNPYMIDLDRLKEEGLLKKSEYAGLDWGDDDRHVDYGKIYNNRFTVLRIASARFLSEPNEDYADWCKENKYWLQDYALFMALKNANNGAGYREWPIDIRKHEAEAVRRETRALKDEIEFYKSIQYMFFKQWESMREYAHAHHVEIIGDVPIYVSPDSCDIWSHPELFQVNEDCALTKIAGCPPDGFSPTGQLWGNPLFNWDYMKKTGYAWWVKRVAHQMSLVDVLRIDHFRGFESYYSIDGNAVDAIHGEWCKGPGAELFKVIEKKLGKLNIIAEDLGFLTPEVIEMVQSTGYPGMKILQFGFDPRDTGSGYKPHLYPRNCVVYAGTHDNEPIIGWLNSADPACVENMKSYFNLTQKEGYQWGIIRGAYTSVADLAVLQLQDVLGLGDEARMNTPSVSGGNWTWRSKKSDFSASVASKLLDWAKKTDRLA